MTGVKQKNCRAEAQPAVKAVFLKDYMLSYTHGKKL